MPRLLTRSLALFALSVGLASGVACKRPQSSSETSHGDSTSDDGEPSRRVRKINRKAALPRPLKLPATAPIIVHVEQPSQAIGGMQTYAPDLPDARALLKMSLAEVPGAGELENHLVGAVDLTRPWDAATVDGQLIVHLPILPARLESVGAMLADKPPVGNFGAVDLQRGAAVGPKLAWLDRNAATLTLADTDRGLVTGSKLAGAYGKQPLRIQLEGAEARKYAPRFDLSRLDLEGVGPHDFKATFEGVPPEVLGQLDQLQPGALTGLLESGLIAAGGSSKYANYANDVKQILADLKRTIDKQSFLVQGNLENLRTRLASALRSWNGRTMVAVGPANHLLIGFGADDPKQMGGALYYFLDGLVDNLGMARSFGVEVPKLRFKRNAVRAVDQNISILVVEGARKLLPSELHPLVDERGDLRIAMAFPTEAGAGMFVLGPASESNLRRWLGDTAKATPATESRDHFAAGTLAIDPTKLLPLLQPGADPRALLGLSAERDPTKVTVVRNDSTFEVRVLGPRVEVREQRIGARLGGTGTDEPAATRPSRTPSGGPTRAPAKPARTTPRATPSAGKPVQN